MVLAVMWYGIRSFVSELPDSRHGIGKGLYAPGVCTDESGRPSYLQMSPSKTGSMRDMAVILDAVRKSLTL